MKLYNNEPWYFFTDCQCNRRDLPGLSGSGGILSGTSWMFILGVLFEEEPTCWKASILFSGRAKRSRDKSVSFYKFTTLTENNIPNFSLLVPFMGSTHIHLCKKYLRKGYRYTQTKLISKVGRHLTVSFAFSRFKDGLSFMGVLSYLKHLEELFVYKAVKISVLDLLPQIEFAYSVPGSNKYSTELKAESHFGDFMSDLEGICSH